MQIVIDLSEDVLMMIKKEVKNNKNASFAEFIIANGTVLPKHGRLVDADALVKKYGDKVAFLNGRVNGEYINAPTILEGTGVRNEKDR